VTCRATTKRAGIAVNVARRQGGRKEGGPTAFVDVEACLVITDSLTDTMQLRGMNARVRAALIREGTQRAWLPTQEADIGGGGQKSGVELGPRCSGSGEPARRWRGSELECFCEERRSRMWKREEGRSAASRDEAGRGGERMGGSGAGVAWKVGNGRERVAQACQSTA
jgi:hypothetical protein